MTNGKLDILVIEDQENHRLDAQNEWDRIRAAGIPLEVSTAETKKGLITALSERKYDGIISDVFFPDEKGGVEEQNGIYAVQLALEKNTPIVLCTSTYHHGIKTEPVHRFCSERYIPLIDGYPSGDENGTVPNKAWGEAYDSLLAQISFQRIGGLSQIIKEALEAKQKGQRWGFLFEKALLSVKPFAPRIDKLKEQITDQLYRPIDKALS